VASHYLLADYFDSFFTFKSGWIPYDAPEGPQNYGISAGTDVNGNQAYVGRTLFRNLQATIGSLLIDSGKNRPPGLYTEFGFVGPNSTTKIEYYAKEKACIYKWIPSSDGVSVDNAIQFEDSYFRIMVGRIFKDGSWHVGSVIVSTQYQFCYEGNKCFNHEYDVLVCEKA
jgi:hypothetical protein